MLFVILCPGTPKAQPAVVLVLKRRRRRGNGLKSHPTDWEKLGIEPATPGLHDKGVSPTPRRLHILIHKNNQKSIYFELNIFRISKCIMFSGTQY